MNKNEAKVACPAFLYYFVLRTTFVEKIHDRIKVKLVKRSL